MKAGKDDSEGKPRTTGRKQDGTFAPGVSGNPAGRPLGARHATTRAIEALLGNEHEALSRKAIELALDGDTTALRLCLDRIAPPRRDAPVSFNLPPIKTVADALAASTSVLKAVAGGEVTPDEAGRIMALLTAHKALVETGDLEARIIALEAK